jgi:hypothetical protein
MKEATMDNPMFARVVIGIGALLVLIALFADPLGLGGRSGFGWKQGLGLVIGVMVILAGLYLGRRGKAPM